MHAPLQSDSNQPTWGQEDIDIQGKISAATAKPGHKCFFPPHAACGEEASLIVILFKVSYENIMVVELQRTLEGCHYENLACHFSTSLT